MKRIFLVLMVGVTYLCGCSKVEQRQPVVEEKRIVPLMNPEKDSIIEASINLLLSKSFNPLADNYWTDIKTPTYIKLFSRSQGNFHAAGADLAGIYARYNWDTQKWNIEAVSETISTDGSSGECGKPIFIKLGPDKCGFKMENVFVSMGEMVSWEIFYTVERNKFVEILTMTTCETFQENSVNVKFFQVIDNTHDYYDLIARLSVVGDYNKLSKAKFDKIFGMQTEVTYTFKDGVYANSNIK
jgi:hypothetical protein